MKNQKIRGKPEEKRRIGIKKRSVITAAVLLILAGGLVAAALLRPDGPARARQQMFYHIEQAPDGTLVVCDGESQPTRESGVIRDHGTGKWWYAENGLVASDYTGFAESGGEQWYVSSGLVDFTKNGLVPAPAGSGKENWYVLGGRALPDYTGLTRELSGCPALMLRGGTVDESFTGLAENEDGWWYVAAGHIDRGMTGLVSGRVNGRDGDWYVLEGKVQLGFSGYIPAEDGTALLLIRGGCTAPESSGILPDGKRFRHVENGRVDLTERRTYEADGARWVLMEGWAWPATDDRTRTLYDAMALLPELTTEDMTQEEKLQACFDYVKGHHEGVSRSPHLLSMEWPEVYAADIFGETGGNCCSFAAAFAYLARAVGYTEVYACNSGSHGWAEIDGFIYDPERAANSVIMTCYGYDYRYIDPYRHAMDTCARDPEERAWMHIKIFDTDREES